MLSFGRAQPLTVRPLIQRLCVYSLFFIIGLFFVIIPDGEEGVLVQGPSVQQSAYYSQEEDELRCSRVLHLRNSSWEPHPLDKMWCKL